MKTTRIKKLLLAGAVVGMLSVGVISGGAIANSFLSGPADPASPESAVAQDYKENSSGLTYGSALNAVSSETEPELILVVATNGKEGYVYKSELDEASGAIDFKSPAEALAWQNSKKSSVALTVYAEDGKASVGEFVVSAGDDSAE